MRSSANRLEVNQTDRSTQKHVLDQQKRGADSQADIIKQQQ